LTPAEERFSTNGAAVPRITSEETNFIRVGNNFDVGKSEADGHFNGEILLSDSEVRRLRNATALQIGVPFAAELPSTRALPVKWLC
jgi:hypothetical protein